MHTIYSGNSIKQKADTVEPRYNEDLGDHENYLVKLLCQVSHDHYVMGQKTDKYKELGPDKITLLYRGFCYIRPLCNDVPLYL